eukprot:10442043-Prorocentrum_lima.AAC.1
MLPTLTNWMTPNLAASSSSIIPSAAGMEGYTRKLRVQFATDQGCPLGRKCQYEHPGRAQGN